MKLLRWQVLALILFISAIASVAWASDKKGVGLWSLHATDRIAALNLAWYYTWQPYAIQGAPLDKFVPMISGGDKESLESQMAYLRRLGRLPVLLAINEPDVGAQAMSVDEVTSLWPEIAKLADSVSSPAPAHAMGPWFERFYRKAQTHGLKMDFMAVHLYSAPDAEKFLKKIDAVYEKYRLPIWITEFAVADWSSAPWESKGRPVANRYKESEVLSFMKEVLPELEKRPYVIRYAWFGAGDFSLTREQVRTSRLFEKDGSLTPLGRFYAEFKWPKVKELGEQ